VLYFPTVLDFPIAVLYMEKNIFRLMSSMQNTLGIKESTHILPNNITLNQLKILLQLGSIQAQNALRL